MSYMPASFKVVAQALHEEVKNYNDSDNVRDAISAETLLIFATHLSDKLREYNSEFDKDKFMESVLNGVPGGFPS